MMLKVQVVAVDHVELCVEMFLFVYIHNQMKTENTNDNRPMKGTTTYYNAQRFDSRNL